MRQYLHPNNFNRLKQYIGDPDEPFKFKSIYTVIVWSPNDRDVKLEDINPYHIIKINPSTPRFPDDYFFYRWIRNSCKSLFGTGRMVRDMKEFPPGPMDFDGNYDMEKYAQYFGGDKIVKQKIYVISRNLDENDVFQERYLQEDHLQKYIFKTQMMSQDFESDQKFKEFGTKHDISLLPCQQTVREAYKFTLQHTGAYPLINDLGSLHLEETLDLIDYMVLTVYRGSLDQSFIGGEMPKISKILALFDIYFESAEFEQHQGFIKFFVLKRKDLK